MFSKIEKVNKSICDKLADCSFDDFKTLLSNCDRYKLINEEGKDEDIKNIYTTTYYYCRKLKHNNYEYKVDYDYGKNRKNGRLFAQGHGIQKINREIRGCLLDGLYYDFDIVNCHYVLLQQICLENNLNYSNINYYIQNRKSILEDFSIENNISYGESKIYFLKILNCDYKIKKIGKNNIKSDIYFKLVDEILNIQNKLIDIFKLEYKETKKFNNKNINGKFLNRVLCIKEGEILKKVDTEFNCNIYMFDGFNKDINLVENVDDYILKLNEYTGLKWDYKENDVFLSEEILKLEKKNKNEYFRENLKEIAFLIYEKFYEDKLFKYKGELYLNSHYWQDNKQVIKDDILNFLMLECNLYIYIPSIRDYVKVHSLKDYKEILEFILLRAKVNNNFINEIFDSSLKKLFFENGYYDIVKKKFFYEKNLNTFKIINKEWDGLEYKEEQKELYEKIFKPVFTIKEGRDDYEIRTKLYKNFMYHLARAVFGCIEDKNWISFEGLRDCGKGAICDLLKKTFNDYIGICNGETFLNNKNLSNDIAKSNSFLMDYEFCRLILTNEVKQDADSKSNIVLDGNKIKKIVSGGDFIQARKNFKDEKEFRIQSTLLYCCNDLPDINPQDAKERQKGYFFKSKFIDRDFKETRLNKFEYYQKDESLKHTFLSNEKIQKAFLIMLIDAFNNYVEYPEETLQETVEDTNDDIEKFYSLFDFDESDESTILLKNIRKLCKDNEIIFNMKKIQLLLLDKGIEKYRSREGICYKGISILNDDVGYNE